jgi:hypothetical protein
MTTITFLVPTQNRRSKKTHNVERTGRVAWLRIGDRKVKFVLQQSHSAVNANDKEAILLTHYASGLIFGRLNEAKIRYMTSRGPYCIPNDRDAAELLIAEKVAAFGAEEVLKRLDAAPTINQ